MLGVLIEERQITLVVTGAEESRTKVMAERALLRVALLNVLHNSLKYSPAHSVLEISYQLHPERSNSLQLIIEDAGPGIAAGEYEKVFERFFRGSRQSDHEANGAGLGLAISRLILERAGGSISFDEAAFVGARCLIEFARLHSDDVSITQ